ncbi:esterase [Naumannella sp. ID2617S]|nr:esterase [Naumannella sp. ID2617S]
MPQPANPEPLAPPGARGGRVRLTLADPDRMWAAVALDTHLAVPLPRSYTTVPGGWELSFPLPPLDRLEYGVRLTTAEGITETVPDPGNPRRAGGSFGDRSWLPLRLSDGSLYAEPVWLGAKSVAHHLEHWGLAETPIGDLAAHVWSPASADPRDDLPMLLVHDGPELDRFGRLTQWVGSQIAVGQLPPLRVVLLEPGDRDVRYSANDAYADVLAEAVGVLRQRWPSSSHPVLIGASLGGLAALQAARRHRGTFAGLWLASGSFFTPRTDPEERAYRFFDRIAAFTADVAADPPDEVAITMVCGAAEENLTNNRLLRDRLRARGLEVGWGTVRDGHNTTCWRDLFEPHLGDLLRRAWGC